MLQGSSTACREAKEQGGNWSSGVWTLAKHTEGAVFLLPALRGDSQGSHGLCLPSQGAALALLSLLSSPSSCSVLKKMAGSVDGTWLSLGRDSDKTLSKRRAAGQGGRELQAQPPGDRADCERHIFLYSREGLAWLLARSSQNPLQQHPRGRLSCSLNHHSCFDAHFGVKRLNATHAAIVIQALFNHLTLLVPRGPLPVPALCNQLLSLLQTP